MTASLFRSGDWLSHKAVEVMFRKAVGDCDILPGKSVISSTVICPPQKKAFISKLTEIYSTLRSSLGSILMNLFVWAELLSPSMACVVFELL